MFENNKLKTGVRKLDTMLGGGLSRGEFMLIGARPGMGKSSLLKQIIRNNEDTVCLYLSDDHCFEHLSLLIKALCEGSNSNCYVVVDDLDQFRIGEANAGILLKNLAKQFNIPVIGAEKLSRDMERRKNKRPVLLDFHKSSMCIEVSIEQYVDVLLGLYRESYYNMDFSVEDENNKGEIIVINNRLGNTGIIDMFFDIRKMLWKET